MIKRQDILQIIYDALPYHAHDKIKLSKEVCCISSTDSGVSVQCQDGSTYAGSLVIGADGVHSIIRRLISTETGLSAQDENGKFESSFRVLWAETPNAVLPGGAIRNVHDYAASCQMVCGDERTWLLLYEPQTAGEKLDREHLCHDGITEMKERWKHMPIGNGLCLEDLISRSCSMGVTNIFSGIASQVSSGRVVLVGDAVHSWGPNLGFGFNCGVRAILVVYEGKLLIQEGRRYHTFDAPHLFSHRR